MDLEAIYEGIMENQRTDALSALPKQSVCNCKIAPAHDSAELDNYIAIADRCSHRSASVLYHQHDHNALRHCLVAHPEISGAEQQE